MIIVMIDRPTSHTRRSYSEFLEAGTHARAHTRLAACGARYVGRGKSKDDGSRAIHRSCVEW